MASSTLSVIHGWKALLNELSNMDLNNSQIYRDFDTQATIAPELSFQAEVRSFFQEKVFPIFASDEIANYGLRLEMEHPWLLDFKASRVEGFPKASRQLQQDPIDMPDILAAYITLPDYTRIKRGLVPSLRDFISRQLQNTFAAHGQEDAGQIYNELALELDDKLFISKFSCHDLQAVYIHFRHLLDQFYSSAREGGPQWAEWWTVFSRMLKFTNMLPPVGGNNNLSNLVGPSMCIEKLRSKTIAISFRSESKEKELHSTIEQLKKENSEYKKQIREYSGIISDLSFRRLFEMLPIAAQDATPAANVNPQGTAQGAVQGAPPYETLSQEPTSQMQTSKSRKTKKREGNAPQQNQQNPPPQKQIRSTSQWQAFWKEAWRKASEGKPGPLNDLWKKSNDLRRTQIKAEGDRIYGLLSANIHDSGRLFDLEGQRQDVIRHAILSALKPAEENFTGDDIDWSKERQRFV